MYYSQQHSRSGVLEIICKHCSWFYAKLYFEWFGGNFMNFCIICWWKRPRHGSCIETSGNITIISSLGLRGLGVLGGGVGWGGGVAPLWWHTEINKVVSQWGLTSNLCIYVILPLTCALRIPCTRTPESLICKGACVIKHLSTPLGL